MVIDKNKIDSEVALKVFCLRRFSFVFRRQYNERRKEREERRYCSERDAGIVTETGKTEERR